MFPGRLMEKKQLLRFSILLLALLYYGSYYRSGFNLMDDGSVVLLSKRIMEGERPIVDLMIGYGVLWFYPIAGLFKLFGTSLIVARIWFFLLAAITALLGYRIVTNVTGNRWAAFAVGVLLVLLPGTNNKTYIPLVIAMNMLFLTGFIQRQAKNQLSWWYFPAAGLALGVTSLIRVELGLFFAALWVGGLCLNLLRTATPMKPKLIVLGTGLLFLTAGVLTVYTPVYLDAKQRGFGKELLAQNTGYFHFLTNTVLKFLAPKPPAAAQLHFWQLHSAQKTEILQTADGASEAAAASSGIQPAPAVEASREIMRRRPVHEIWTAKRFNRRAMVFSLYAPIAGSAILIGASLFFLSRGLIRKNGEDFDQFLILLLLTGSALTAFPQYFFFRPDVAHLSEFMPGFLIAGFAGGWMIYNEMRSSKLAFRLAAGFAVGFLMLHGAVYTLWAMDQKSAGTIAQRHGRTERFVAENGVDIYLTPEEHKGFTAIRDIILAHSTPEDYVLCHPYSPGINFMTNRRTYEGTLYYDNWTRPQNFSEETIRKMETYRPPVIAINNWSVNRNEDSRFSNWARPAYEHIRQNYRHAGTFLRNEIYVLPSSVQGE
jgi:4-amino-4-deoxy-L-arabinose transferase-like glycosyltransferase